MNLCDPRLGKWLSGCHMASGYIIYQQWRLFLTFMFLFLSVHLVVHTSYLSQEYYEIKTEGHCLVVTILCQSTGLVVAMLWHKNVLLC